MDLHGLRKGNNRLAFAPDGSLWTGQAQHGFVGDLGIQRIVYSGKEPMDIYTMHLLQDGFELSFTQQLNDSTLMDPAHYSFRHYFYDYHLKYGSDQYDVKVVPVSKVEISEDQMKIVLKLSEVKQGYIYELTLKDIYSSTGVALENKLICYTVNKLKK